MSAEAEFWTFPTNPEEFDRDDRISFSRLDNKYIAVQDDGTEYEFDNGLRRWIPVIDEALIEEQQRGYMMPGADTDDTQPQSRPAQGKKRKGNHSNDREPKQNTAVYVTGLPPDATVDEVAELFSRKCGVIAEEIDSGRPRVKLYTDADGNFKGDALIVFFKPQSVDMAIMLLDDTDFRFTASGLTSGKMRVQAADSSYKKTNYAAGAPGEASNSASNANIPTGANGSIGNGSSSSNADRPKPGAGNNQRSHQDKAKIIKKTQKLDAKLADWDDDEPAALYPELAAQPTKREKVVILRHMFTLEELEEDPAAMLDIKDDIREECAKLGPVTNVVLFDKEEEGIVSVRFQTTEAAEACVNLMHGRAFDGRTVEAFFATGKERFNKSKKGDDNAAAKDSDGE